MQRAETGINGLRSWNCMLRNGEISAVQKLLKLTKRGGPRVATTWVAATYKPPSQSFLTLCQPGTPSNLSRC
jgi:hypothetical protein